MNKVEAWQCQYCGKLYKLKAKHYCAKHEKYCKENPDNKHACSFCKHLEAGFEEVKNDWGETVGRERTFYCPKIKEHLHSYVAERRAANGAEWAKAAVEDTVRMPNKCEHFEIWRDDNGE